ncbi:hypothetical protein CHUAL_006885 [Chamberlinius hualienensis]
MYSFISRSAVRVVQRDFLAGFQFLNIKPLSVAHLDTVKMSTKLQPADRIKDTEENIWVEFNKLALIYKPVNLGQGFPDTAPPDYVSQAVVNAMKSKSVGVNQYTQIYGHKRLVNILAKLYSKLIQREIDPINETLITVGAYQALYCTIMGNINPGDEVIIIEPFFDCYEPMVKMAEGTPVFIPLKPTKQGQVTSSGDWVLDYDELSSKFNEKTKAIILNTPNNPLGKVYKREELEKIAELAKKWDVLVISDEVYEWMVYDQLQHIRIATLPGMWERTITIGSAGKTFSVTGWKVGWAYGPNHLIKNLHMIHDNFVNCVAVPIQEAVAVGFETEINRLNSSECYFNALPSELVEKRDYIVKVLSEAGLYPVVPEGGYFILADYSNLASKVNFDEEGSTKPKDHQFCKWMIKEKRIAAIPPSAFYSAGHKTLAENFIRICFFKKNETLEAARKILEGLRQP